MELLRSWKNLSKEPLRAKTLGLGFVQMAVGLCVGVHSSLNRGIPPDARRNQAHRVPAAAATRWDESMRKAGQSLLAAALSLSVAFCAPAPIQARPEGVNKPELLPSSFTSVIDVAGFLSEGQEVRIAKEIKDLEELTGFKLRVLAQNYPNTPGLAVRDFWKVDDSTIVFVADPSLGNNILNFNVGAAVDLNVPRSFWTRLAGQYGNVFFWREMGEDASIEAAVSAISTCLREPPGPRACSTIN